MSSGEGTASGSNSRDIAAITAAMRPFDPSDFAISIDGMTLIHHGTATATSSLGDIAIAMGANSEAQATGGIFDSASAFGTNDLVHADDGSLDVATVFGNDDIARAQLSSGDFASIVGAGDEARAGYAGPFPSRTFPATTTSPRVFGNGSTALAGSDPASFGNFDLGAVFGDMLHAMATGGNLPADILA